jgi:hypothetical protein
VFEKQQINACARGFTTQTVPAGTGVPVDLQKKSTGTSDVVSRR